MRIKAFLLSIAMAIALISLAGCGAGKGLKITGSPSLRDGVTVTLEKASAERKTKPDRYEYSFSGTIENDTDEGVMKVIYRFELFDKDGKEFRSFAEVYDGQDKAIPPHSKISFSHNGIKWGAQSVPASVAIVIGSVSMESQLPPVKIPQAGDFLYQTLGDEKLANIKSEPPVELSFHIDQGGYGRTATFTEGELLSKAVKLLCDIRIAEETNEYITDNYNWIGLIWADGSSTYISLNLKSLEYNIHSSTHVYKLENLSEFWSFASEYLEEDE